MKKNPFIYLRGLKHAKFTVFCVDKGQKSYYDPQFNVSAPYSSGQQVKRSIMKSILDNMNIEPAPITFYSKLDKNGRLGEGEVVSLCDPLYVDQLLGGWMQALSGGTSGRTLKRRSPFSISAMTPLHPLLAFLPKENVSFDRSDRPDIHKVIVKDANGNELNEEQISDLLEGSPRSLLRKWIQNNNRATGLFTYDIAIDLRRLFCVSTSMIEPEVSEEVLKSLREKGWKLCKNAFGDCLVMPEKEREKIIPAIADALINWHITSNQARTFSLMETLAISISDNANTLAASIRAKLIDDGNKKPKVKPIVERIQGANTYITLPCAGYVLTEDETVDALEQAKQDLIERMTNFDYENQL